MSNIRYILLILIIFPFIELCAQNEAQNSINHALDSLKLGKYKSAILILETVNIDNNIAQKQSDYAQMLLEIAYFHKPSLKFDMVKLENSMNHVECDNLYNITGFKTLVEINSRLKEYEKSIKWGNEGLRVFKHFGDNEMYADLLGDIAFCYYSIGDIKNAIRYYQNANDIIHRYYNRKDTYHSKIWLSDLSRCYEKSGNYSKAIKYLLQSMNRGGYRMAYFDCPRLEQLYKMNGDDKNAAVVRKEWETTFFDLNKLLRKLTQNENVADVKALIKTDIEIQRARVITCQKKYGLLHQEYAQALTSLARCFYNEGILDSAIAYQNQAKSIYFRVYGNEYDSYQTASINLAFYYGKKGNYLKAIELECSNIDILQEIIGVNDSTRISALTKLRYVGLGGLHNELKNLSISLHNLADWNAGIGDYDKAIKLDTEALVILKEIDKNLDYDGTRIPETLALNYLEIKDYENSYKMLQEAFDLRKEIVLKKFLLFISQERETYWDSKKIFFQDLPQFAIEAKDPYNSKVASICYDAILFSKGLLLNTSVEIDKMILNSGDTISIQLYNRLRQLNNKPDQRDDADTIVYIRQLLINKSKVFGDITHELKITWKEIQPVIKDKEVAIEFSFYKSEDKMAYCALILKKGNEYPVMVPLFEQKQLDSLFAGGNAMPNSLYATRGVTAYYGDQLPIGQKLYKLIWEPLEKELQDVKTVYYSPSGSLHQISFAALPTDTSHYLCDKYNLVQLSSTRQLATLAWQNKPGQISSTALFGGIKYDLEGSEIAELQRSLPKNEMALVRGFTPDSSFRSTSFGLLPGTKDEVNSIATKLKTKKIKTDLYTGINGNEEAFKSLSNQNVSVLHIATHGFFYPDENEKPQDLDRMMLMGEQKFRYIPNPLRRSGLILAGGNRTWNGEQPIAGMEDGILTAQEISEMNLQNTELVVLSACETGLGDIKGGEGVFGLQRAFKLAGAKTIIMSLWKVPDGSTSEMMQLFYSKWLGGMDKQEAFRETQREMRYRYPKSPKDWAGFVMLD